MRVLFLAPQLLDVLQLLRFGVEFQQQCVHALTLLSQLGAHPRQLRLGRTPSLLVRLGHGSHLLQLLLHAGRLSLKRARVVLGTR